VKYEIIKRQQRARGQGFAAGPNAYMALVEIPNGGESVGMHPLSYRNKQKYGWKVIEEHGYYRDSRHYWSGKRTELALTAKKRELEGE